MTGVDVNTPDPLVLWRTVLESVGKISLHHHVLYLLCLQWAIWLANCHLKTIEDFQVNKWHLIGLLEVFFNI